MVSKKKRHFTFKIAVFLGFKSENILSSKLNTVTKIEISPQRKLGSLRNLTIKKFSWRSVDICTRTNRKRAHSRWNVLARVYDSCACTYTPIFKHFLVVNYYLKFPKDLSFRWGDIPLFVTMYDLELKILSFSNPSKNAILSGKKRTLRFIFFKKIFDNNTQKPFIW